MSLVVVVPTRGRPESAERLAGAFARTCTAGTELVFIVDDDDPERDAYRKIPSVQSDASSPDGGLKVAMLWSVPAPKVRGMVTGLNAVVNELAYAPVTAIGFMGDDHLPVTLGWDSDYLAALADVGTGIVYGNDLVQGERLPTQCAMSADIIRELGWMCPPVLRHLFVDDFWRDLGREAECLRYLPDVVVEHLHPVAGTAPMDDGYRRVNAPLSYAIDRGAYDQYCRSGGLAAAVATVRQLRGDRRG